jgi:hypothetical protein
VNRNRKVLLLVSVMAAVCIFSAYWVTALLNQPLTISKTTTLATASWEIDRPGSFFSFYNVGEVGGTFTYNDLTIHVGITPDSIGADEVEMSLNIEADGNVVYPEFFNCTFHVNDANSTIAVPYVEDHNCSVVSDTVSGTVQQDRNFVLAANNTSCSDSRLVDWIFYDQSYMVRAMEHTLNVSVECIYKNGSVNEKVIFPIVLTVVPDAGNGFSDAENISFGTYNRTIDNVDFCDFFAIRLNNSERINVSIKPPYDSYLAYTLFDPDRVSVQQGEFNSASVFMYDVNATGTWYIEVQQALVQGHINEGQYSIEIMEEAR